MCAAIIMLLLLNSAAGLSSPPPASHVIIDGELTDSLWQHAPAVKLAPVEAGVPAAQGGEIRAVIAGGYLYVGAELPEPSGRITARSIGFDPVWEGGGVARSVTLPRRYAYGAPDGEDFVRFIIRVYNENDWLVQVGPLGGYSIKWRWTGEHAWFDSLPYKCDRFLVAAAVGKEEWSAEAAIPMDQIGSPRPGYVRVMAERNRAERPGTPEEWWRWPVYQPTSGVPAIPTSEVNLATPVFRPPEAGNSKLPPIEVGYRKDLPSLYSRWDSPGWRNVPVWTLRRNEPAARLPRYPTEVKSMHDGKTLAILARCIEPDGVIARATRRDGLVTEDDSFQVYLATSGSAYVQYAINPRAYVLDAAGHQGGARLSEPHSEWNSPVRGAAWQSEGEWVARLDLPLDSIAEAVGEVHIPAQWKALLLRHRPGRNGEPEETSVLPVTQSRTPLSPARYRRMELVKVDPSELPRSPLIERSGNLAFLPSRVFSPEQRAQMNLSGMLESYLRNRTLKDLEAEKQSWEGVKDLDDWERFRDARLNALRASLGPFPARCPLEIRVASEYRGQGYRRENLVYQSQPGIWVTANLYLPAEPHKEMPGIIILHSHHAPKTQFELQDMGIIWARSGCAVLVMDLLGYGERMQNYPWDREAHNSSTIMGVQLQLNGENLTKWRVWDAIRAVDVLFERKDINQKQIILLGAVAGGGDIAGVAAALDPRITAVAPFNFGEAEPEEIRFLPEKNQWPLNLADPGWGDMESTGIIPRATVDEFLPWFICASVAPRRFIYSFELGWNVEEQPAWARYRKVFGFYNALDNLADAHGFGPFPGPGEAWNIGPTQRRSLYPTLERWFGIPIPFRAMKASAYANLQKSPITARRPVSDLAVLTPAMALELHMRSVHDIAHEEGEAEVNAARSKLSAMAPEQRRDWLRSAWAKKLGDIEPNPHPQMTLEWTKRLPNAVAEALALETEPGIEVPVLLLLPRRYHPYPHAVLPMPAVPVVVAVAQGGKDLFVARRSAEIEALLKNGVAVCLPDVRGTGETSPNPKQDPDGDEIREHLAGTELTLGNTLLGERLKDMRTVLSYLRNRQDVDGRRIGLWGDSFAPPNPFHLLIEELPQWQIGPQIEQEAEPLGGLLALLGGLYENGVRTIAVQSGLASYLSILDDSFAYLPADVIVPGILQAGDISDLTAALAPRPLLLEGLVDGRDRLLKDSEARSILAPVYEAYRTAPSATLSIRSAENASHFADWFLRHL